MSMRKFGVEIEHISKLSHALFVQKLKELRLPVDDYATGHSRCPNDCYSGWQVKTDGSVTVQGEYNYAIELVSPPMSLANLGELKTALAVADKYGAINSSCGLHVHIHSPELAPGRESRSEPSVRRITTEWSKIEQAVFSYMPLSRRGNTHCKAGINTGDRYQAINLRPLSQPRRTIEFRVHSASLNFNKISAWIMFCIKFVDFLALGKQFDNAIDPRLVLPVQPRLIKPRHGTMFYLHRPHPNWAIEAKKLNAEFPDLLHAWEATKESLKLPGLDYLSDFRFPMYGNAMTTLCQTLNIKGIYRSYIEDRYDRITKKFGFFDSSQNITTLLENDEDNFYNEPDYVSEERP